MVGLGTAAQNYLIPVDHPKGPVLVREHMGKVSVQDKYPVGHPKTLTPTGKLRNAHEDTKVAATYLPKPDQLFPDEAVRVDPAAAVQ